MIACLDTVGDVFKDSSSTLVLFIGLDQHESVYGELVTGACLTWKSRHFGTFLCGDYGADPFSCGGRALATERSRIYIQS